MAEGQKYAALPGLDEAPDTYETFETGPDSQSTKSSRSSSTSQDTSTSSTSDDLTSGISRAALQPGSARSQFSSARVDARNVDFTDRIGGRKSYKVGRRTKKTEFEGVAGVIDREDETFAERIARLKREIEEVKAISESSGEGKVDGGVVEDLGEVLRRLDEDESLESKQTQDATQSDQQETHAAPPTKSPRDILALSLPDNAASTRALSLAATLESRLSTLETALGLPALSLPTFTSSSTTTSTSEPTTISTTTQTPILTTLTHLQSQLSNLTNTTAPTLNELSTQIDSLTSRANALTTARRNALTALKDLRAAPPLPFPTAGTGARPYSSGTSASFSTSRPTSYARSRAPTGSTSFDNASGTTAAPGSSGEQGPDMLPPGIDAATIQTLLTGAESETATRISQLHAQLPTIEALSPLLPRVLERLGDLRLLHAEAAGAGEAVQRIEGRLDVLSRGINEWRNALAELEVRVKEAESVEGGNREVVEGWVGELEGRVKELVGGKDGAKVPGE